MDQSVFKKRVERLIVVLVVLIVLLIGWSIYYASTFHVVSTVPSSKKITTVSTSFKINFSKALSSNSLSVTSSPSIIKSSSISGKTLTLELIDPLDSSKKNTITVDSISSASGKSLSNIKFTFTPTFVNPSINSLPTNQQNSLIQQQSGDTTGQPPTFTGTDALLSEGVSAAQIQDFEQGVTNFAQIQKITLRSIIIDTTSVTTGPLNPNTGVFSILFNLSINGTNYGAKLSYSDITSAELFLYNSQTNAQVFDSGSISV